MKVGILTFHRAINYGALLQAYALQQAVKQLGRECFIIDYRCSYLENPYKLIDIRRWSNIKAILADLAYFPILNLKHKKFKAFIEKNIYLGEFHTSFNCSDLYDCFITGSDQVWNYQLTDFDKTYFLNFTERTKRNSYAASFGLDDIPSQYTSEYNNLLKEFRKISVRENRGADIISSLIGQNVNVVIDPTLLLTDEEWYKVASPNKTKYPYVLIYELSYSKSLHNFASYLAKKKNYNIIYINDSLIERENVKYKRSVGPEEWLALFRDAEYIVTNSFHGTAFSINFRKQFFTELLPPPYKVNSRLENILDTFQLRDRIIMNGENKNIDKSINYNSVLKILEKKRQHSIDFLKQIVSENNE
jgi:hypothetical protein